MKDAHEPPSTITLPSFRTILGTSRLQSRFWIVCPTSMRTGGLSCPHFAALSLEIGSWCTQAHETQSSQWSSSSPSPDIQTSLCCLWLGGPRSSRHSLREMTLDCTLWRPLLSETLGPRFRSKSEECFWIRPARIFGTLVASNTPTSETPLMVWPHFW